MHRKSNPIGTALSGVKDGMKSLFSNGWHLFHQISRNFYLLSKSENTSAIKYTIVYVFNFRFVHPHWHTKADMLFYKYPDPSKIPTVAERLQYFRNKKSLLQKDVAKAVGIDRSTYISYENPAHKNYPLNVLEKIADLYDVNITALLDDYNRFLYDGQANQIQSTRKSLGLTQYHFGELYGVSARTVRGWEKDRIQISKKVWKRIYKQEMAAL